jgi:hypothetical protein
VGFAPTGKRRLCTAHTQSSPSFLKKQSLVRRSDRAFYAVPVLDVGAGRKLTGRPAEALFCRRVNDPRCGVMCGPNRWSIENRHRACQLINLASAAKRLARVDKRSMTHALTASGEASKAKFAPDVARRFAFGCNCQSSDRCDSACRHVSRCSDVRLTVV